MIKFRFSDSEDWRLVTPTIFPDGTSQVWKLDLDNVSNTCTIRWHFENEAELFHLAQLVDLVFSKTENLVLELPYFPYARQDKKISNETTFTKTTFLELLKTLYFDEIITYDIHSETNPYVIKNQRPNHFLEAIRDFKPDAIFFPDAGAMTRYQKSFYTSPDWNMIPKLYGEKVRDQKTGEITSYTVVTHKDFLNGDRILIVDDICDGGATFISAARELNKLQVKDIGLCISHGIFSKGTQGMREAGISKFYTTDSFVRHKIENYENVIVYKSL